MRITLLGGECPQAFDGVVKFKVRKKDIKIWWRWYIDSPLLVTKILLQNIRSIIIKMEDK